MTLSRTNSRKNLAVNNSTDDTKFSPNKVSKEIVINLETTSTSTSMTEVPTSVNVIQKKAPKMQLQITAEQESPKKNELNLLPRTIPKSPRLLKNKNSIATESISPRNDLNSSSQKNDNSYQEKKEINQKNASMSNQIPEIFENSSSSSEPIIQVRRITFKTSKLPNTNISTTTSPSSPRFINQPSSANLNEQVTTTSTNSQQEINTSANINSDDACSAALLYLIFKKYETSTLSSASVHAFGREDIYFPVKSIPRILTQFTEFPDNGITSVSELLIALFGNELIDSPAWNSVKHSIHQGLCVDDKNVLFGETEPEIKDKYFALLKPHAIKIAESILGSDKKISASALPEKLLRCLFEGDKKLLAICLASKKLRTKEINDARIHFLFDMVVTRLAQVLIMKNLSDKPSQVESWFASAIIDALGERIKALSNDFLEHSNNNLPEDLKKNFFDKVAAETREDDAIKRFQLIALKKNRISELQKKEIDSSKKYEHGRGHRRVNSHTMLVNVKLERNYKKMLDDLQTQCGFDEMEPELINFVVNNPNMFFDPGVKVSMSNIILNLKLAVREYEQMKLNKGLKVDKKIEILIKNLDYLFENEFNAKQKRRTTAFSKNLIFSDNQGKGFDNNNSENTSFTSSSVISTSASSIAGTTASATSTSSTNTSTAAHPIQPNESSSEEN